jgi:hypothetical protein
MDSMSIEPLQELSRPHAALDAAFDQATLGAAREMLDGEIQLKPRWLRPFARSVRNNLLAHYRACESDECSTCARLLAKTSAWQEHGDQQVDGHHPRAGKAQAAKPSDPSVARAVSLAACEAEQCVVCLTNQKTMAYVPCGHLCVCAGCARSAAAVFFGSAQLATARCPICRGHVEQAVRIFQ